MAVHLQTLTLLNYGIYKRHPHFLFLESFDLIIESKSVFSSIFNTMGDLILYYSNNTLQFVHSVEGTFRSGGLFFYFSVSWYTLFDFRALYFLRHNIFN